MQIIYGYSNCTDHLYNEIVSEKNVRVLQPDQKYHGLLIKGLARNDADVFCFSGLPVNQTVTSKKWIRYPDEQEKNILYHYYTTLNIPGLRQLMIFLGAFSSLIKLKATSDTYAICDCLNISNAYGIVLACKVRRIPIITIVTDLPDMMGYSRLIKKVNNLLFGMMDGFVFLTEQMNLRLNKKQKPYVVLEGHVDSEASPPEKVTKWEEDTGRKIILYAGSIKKIYGIKNLVSGFLKAHLADTELWIFGDGDYRRELENISKTCNSIKYKGVSSNDEVVEQEMKASLLVNPRPSAPEYTKYSFPSKNMEYMVSGTPVLTTALPGMPEEYKKYVYLLDDESPEGIAGSLRNILNKPIEERCIQGNAARDFVLRNKSNIMQAKKIIQFLRNRV